MSEFACRLLAYMDSRGYDTCVPVNDDPGVTEQPLLDFSAGYVLRSIDQFPRAGLAGAVAARHELRARCRHPASRQINDGTMRFSRRAGPTSPRASRARAAAGPARGGKGTQ